MTKKIYNFSYLGKFKTQVLTLTTYQTFSKLNMKRVFNASCKETKKEKKIMKRKYIVLTIEIIDKLSCLWLYCCNKTPCIIL
jgi:hypothetical protein